MTNALLSATVRGVPNTPSITEINVRSGPGTLHTMLFKSPVGTRNLQVVEVRGDAEQKGLNGKVYQWFKLNFPNGQSGWARDDLLEIQGDGTSFGYGVVSTPTFAFTLMRAELVTVVNVIISSSPAPIAPPPSAPPAAPPPPPAPVAAPAMPAVSATPSAADQERIRRAAFNITAAFEGGGYATYQNYDSGIVSYGRFQFTLAAGSLATVLNKYLEKSNTAVANELRTAYQGRVNSRDANLRQDARFKDLLIQAANEPPMQEAQDQAATQHYWNLVQELSIQPRGIKTPLGQALVFDMAINFGPRHGFLSDAEASFGAPAKSMLGTYGATEAQLIGKLAELRRASHYRQAERDNLPGLKVRGDFWVNLIQQGDWQLQGDASGNLTVKTGRVVQVRNP